MSDDLTKLGQWSLRVALLYPKLSPAAKAAWDAKAAVRNAALAEREALLSQLREKELKLYNISPLPAQHPARALEDGLIADIQALRQQADAIVIPPHPGGDP